MCAKPCYTFHIRVAVCPHWVLTHSMVRLYVLANVNRMCAQTSILWWWWRVFFCVLSLVSIWTYVFSFFLSHLLSKLMFLSNMSSKLKTQAAMSGFQRKLSKFRLPGFVVKKCGTFGGPSVVGAQKISSKFWDDMFHILWWWPIYCLLGDGPRPQSIYGIAAVGGFCNFALIASGQLWSRFTYYCTKKT